MSSPAIKVAVNPLPWVLTRTGWSMTPDVLRSALSDLREVGFRAIHSEIPDGMSVADYRRTLADFEFEPAPGYFSADFSDRAGIPEVLDQAREAAQVHAELGLSQMFVAETMAQPRLEHPATGFQPDGERLSRITEGLAAVAVAMLAEGVVAALHPHVGTWVETDEEVRSVLDGSAGSSLAFGPDTGHLFWGGADPAQLIKDYADRVVCLHLKDVDAEAASEAARHGDDYMAATFGRHVWTEPGRGDVDIDAVISALPEGFDGWGVLEVDVPNLPTRVDSARAGMSYLRANPAFDTAPS